MGTLDDKTVSLNMIIGAVVALGMFCSVLMLQYSWIKLLTLSLTLVFGITWFLSRGKLKKTVKYLLLSLMIFSVCFSWVEGHVFWNAGYPPTYDASMPDITISYPNILNVSLTELVQDAEQTTAFNLFQLEHFGETTFKSLELSTSSPYGEIEIEFYNRETSTSLMLRSTMGHQYIGSTVFWSRGPTLYCDLVQQQSPQEALRQMDNLGLQWFYDRISDVYQNTTGTALNTTTLAVSTDWQEYNDYNGMILQLIGGQRDGSHVHGIVFAAFQPNGTMLYCNCKNP